MHGFGVPEARLLSEPKGWLMCSISFRVINHPKYHYELTRAHTHVLRHYEPLRKYRATIEQDGTKWVELYGDGLLHIHRGYCWDGASGPALDTMSMARASLIHDAGLQLIAEGQLPIKPWKKHFDQEFRLIMKENGVPWFRRQYAYAAVRLFGRGRDKYAHPELGLNK